MSGNIFEELKKNDLSKKREKLKFFVAILSTNLVVALASWSLLAGSPPAQRKTALGKKQHPQFKMIVVPLTVMAEIKADADEVPVTLMNKNKQVLIQKAYLHEEVRAQSAEGLGITRFKIEIPEGELLKISDGLADTMIAIPEVQPAPSKVKGKPKVSKYEVSL